jgi:hypothetical protein
MCMGVTPVGAKDFLPLQGSGFAGVPFFYAWMPTRGIPTQKNRCAPLQSLTWPDYNSLLCNPSVYFSSITFFAFSKLTTFLPVLASNSLRATFATLPPCFATLLLASKFFGSTAYEISFVEASASIFKPLQFVTVWFPSANNLFFSTLQ